MLDAKPTPALSARDRLIVALDLPSAEEARRAVREIGESVSTYKVGMQLFTAAGPDFVRELIDGGKRVFLDLKLHEIPNSIAEGVRAAGALGVDMVSVHASAGSAGLKAALEAAAGASKPLVVVALTVVTSMDDAALREIGVKASVWEQTLRLARLARASGCGGLVASPADVAMLRKELGDAMAIAVAGVRPAGAAQGDQARVATPTAAIRAGATYLMMGRPVLGAADRAGAAQAVVREIEAALAT